MWFVRFAVRAVLFCVIMVAVCWGVALSIDGVPWLDSLIDQQILEETSIPLAMLKAGVLAMIVGAVVIGLYKLVGRLLRIR